MKKFETELKRVLENDEYLIEINKEGFPFKYDIDFRIEVLKAVNRNANSLLEVARIESEDKYGNIYTEKSLLKDKAFMMKAADITEFAIEFASRELRNDKEFVLKCVAKDGRKLRFAGRKLQNDAGL